MKYLPIESTLFKENRKRLLPLLEKNATVLLFSNDAMPRNGDQCFAFRQSSNLYYLCGIDQSNTILMLSPEQENPLLREVLFIERSTSQSRTWTGERYSVEQAVATSGIPTVYYMDQFDAISKEIIVGSESLYLDLPENAKFSTPVPSASERYLEFLKKQYPLHNYKRLCPLMAYLRLYKTEKEIELITKACEITANTFFEIAKNIAPGQWEYEIEADIVANMLRRRATTTSFDSIVAAGKNACVLHYTQNNAKCEDGDLLLLDFGAEYANYAGDLSRTLPVNGRFSSRQKQVYQACLAVFDYAKTLYKPGMTINKAHELVLIKMQEQLIALGLFEKSQDVDFKQTKSYFPHGLAHFVGLDVHDVGDKNVMFDYGMVLSCEPGIYIPQEAIGIRIETVMLVADAPIDLMGQVPTSADDIEALMIKNKKKE